MKKKGRSRVLFNKLDYEILRAIKKRPLPIMRLRDIVDVKHKNLKPRIDRLVELRLIKRAKVQETRINLLSLGKKKDVERLLKLFK